jgi:hypothetical protein
MTSWLLGRFIALVAAAALCAQVGLSIARPNLTPIRSDGYSYYVYLPNWFLYGDITLQAVADDCCGGRYPTFTAIIRWPGTERWVNAHPIGVAVMTAPFFAAAHALTLWSNLPADGFSLYYQRAVPLAATAYVLLGLAALRALLRHNFSDGVVLATLAALTFGTNVFHYAVYDASYSHAFAFCLVCWLMVLVDRWWASPPGWMGTLALGAVAGLIVLVRHPNALFLALIPLFGITAPRDIPPRAKRLMERRGHAVLLAAVAALVVLPQLGIYKQATGSWLVSSYGTLGFSNAASPKIAAVLVGVQKGLFFWSPVLLLAVAGLLVPTSWARNFRLATLLVFTGLVGLIASWHDWQFGGSFGHRGFTDALPLLAPFLASFFAWAWPRPRRRLAVALLTATLVTLSVLQMLQYWLGVLPIMGTTWEQYKSLFLRFP